MIIKLYLPGKMRLSLGKKSNVANAAANEILYIGGSEVLPPPLEGEEENRAINGLETERASEARALLIEHNLRLVVYIAKKFDNTGVGIIIATRSGSAQKAGKTALCPRYRPFLWFLDCMKL